jgi:hypothetical protein
VRLRWKPRAIPIELRMNDKTALGRWLSLTRWRVVRNECGIPINLFKLPETEEKFTPHLTENWWTTWQAPEYDPWWAYIFGPSRDRRAYQALLEMQELGVVDDRGIVAERDDNERQTDS